MDKNFSVDEFSAHFWSTPSTPPPPHDHDESDPKMNRSASEWAFQKFIQEHDALKDPLTYQHHHYHDDESASDRNNEAAAQPGVDTSSPSVIKVTPDVIKKAPFSGESSAVVGSDQFQEFLKTRLDLACAAVALTRAPYVIGQSPSGAAQATSQQSTDSHAVAPSSGKGPIQKDVGGPIGIPSLPAMPKKLCAQIKPATSGSSRDLSDDDEAEGENDLNDNMDPDDSKRARRMLSNRESARRSRRRKQEHVSELETQVSELKVENSSLLNRYTDISHKYNESAVDNRVLKADVETLRAKVKMAEETVKRVTGMNTLLQTISIPAFSGSPSDSIGHAAVSPYDDPKQHFLEPHAPSNPPRRF